jgi:hypothetical protein
MNDYDYDVNKDGKVTDIEAELQRKIIEFENKDKKEEQQRKMANMAMYSMLILTVLLLLPILPAERVEALSDLLTMFYIAQAGIVASFFGASAYMNVNR